MLGLRHRVGRALSWDRVCGRFYSNAELEAGAASVGAVRRALSCVAVARGGFGARGTLCETICVLPRRNDRAFSLRPSLPIQIVRLRCSPDNGVRLAACSGGRLAVSCRSLVQARASAFTRGVRTPCEA